VQIRLGSGVIDTGTANSQFGQEDLKERAESGFEAHSLCEDICVFDCDLLRSIKHPDQVFSFPMRPLRSHQQISTSLECLVQVVPGGASVSEPALVPEGLARF
jgi:hypothetical protein